MKMTIDTHDLLIKLGFEESNLYAGSYFCPTIKHVRFDFSASNIESIVKVIWDRAYEQGKIDKVREIKNVLDI
jgi:hypothetical protein